MSDVKCRKSWSCRVTVLSSLVVGVLLATACAVVGPQCACAADGKDKPRYGRIMVPADKSRHDLRANIETEDWKHYQNELARRWHEVHEIVGEQHISRKSQELLRRRGLGPALLDGTAKAGLSGRDSGPDTLRVLIVRISFQENSLPNLTTIAPDGDFVLEAPAEADTVYIDPPPHNKSFYESHLYGLSQYYHWQSGGRLQIEGRVLPEGEDDSYQLSDIADYGPGAGNSWTIEGLEALVRDMLTTADAGTQADGSANLYEYGDDYPFTYVIFVHAGSDWQSDINNDSPNDIPTFFVTLGEPQAITGGEISECSVIPETTRSGRLRRQHRRGLLSRIRSRPGPGGRLQHLFRPAVGGGLGPDGFGDEPVGRHRLLRPGRQSARLRRHWCPAAVPGDLEQVVPGLGRDRRDHHRRG